MKKLVLGFISLALLLVTIASSEMQNKVPEEAEQYIQREKEHLDSLAQKQVDSLFIHGHTDVFPIYAQCKSRYIKENFWSQTGTMFRKDLWDWNYENRLPDDVVSTYHVAPENEFGPYGDGIVEGIKIELRWNSIDNDKTNIGIRGFNRKGIWQTRWALGVNENWGGKIVQYVIIPYAVSFRKQSYGSAESFISVDDALDFAFDFYTESDKSDLKKNIVRNVDKFSNGPIISNSYYALAVDSDAVFTPTTITNSPAYDHCMYNDYFYVFVRAYGQKIYRLTLQEGHVEFEKEQYIASKLNYITNLSSISISILITLWIIFFIWIVWDIWQSKRSFLQRIINKCNPKRFIKNYQGEKLKSANDIYSKAIATNANDEKAVIELASRAENELGIFIISKNDTKRLKTLCNPKRFMKPYDAKKVEKANFLYGKLKQGIVSYSDYAKIKEEVSLLYDKKESVSASLVMGEDSSN